VKPDVISFGDLRRVCVLRDVGVLDIYYGREQCDPKENKP
jgi:hypothetical protein